MPASPLRLTAALALLTALGLWGLAAACPGRPAGEGGEDSPVPREAEGAPDAGGAGDGGADAGPVTRAPWGLEARPANPTCVAPEAPQPARGVRITRAFPRLRFSEPLLALQAPGDASRVYVVERAGRVLAFPNDEGAAQAEVVLDLRDAVDSSDAELGLLGLAFHPDFRKHGEVFLSYTRRVSGQRTSRLSRMVSRDGGRTLERASEQVVLEFDQPYSVHKGGHVAFGPDGFLYAGYGDGGGGGDPNRTAQDPRELLGKLLRLDVDGKRPYAIPRDNPFARGGGRPEIYALGFRNPWRWSFDRATGELWLADVGEKALEEVNRVTRGGNYGWSVMEGTRCFRGAGCNGPGLALPVLTYGRSEGVSITGGYVYRGARVPDLAGQYVYGDFGSGRVWAFDPGQPKGGGNPRLVAATSLAVASFAELLDGELLVVDFAGGGLHRVGASAPGGGGGPAARLSQTGCVEPGAPARMAGGLVPYGVNAPLWSDGADKERFLAVPDGQAARLGEEGRLELPPGTVLVKHFDVAGRRVETRLFMRHPDGSWAGYSYAWDAAGTDAVLLEAGETRALPGGGSWTYPGRGECMQCHNAAAGYVLGLEVAQLAGDFTYPGGVLAPQLDTLAHVGLLEGLTDDVRAAHPPLARPEAAGAPAEARARAYLHANCAACHRPRGPGRGTADLRASTPLAAAGICEALPEATSGLGGADARLLVPGEPGRSLLSLRMHRRGAGQMPPLASDRVDAEGVALVDAWIRGLGGCP